ncbi:hypothetical protein [Puniceicoccus vermicola]|uniref:ABC transporter ATP-binding protein n=1 Tax=Puniceicoccus vermicola TaxID=388746 RepID=A0A7X1B1I0_9BACT|nr:hypothetical protein [Puniceicoccus vermicola]MBC2603744.1 hypothetical protein [Puniceicoccus vermicola]
MREQDALTTLGFPEYLVLCRGFSLDPPLTIREADQVLLLDQGEISERGNHRDLLSEKGHYADLYRRFTEE